MNNCFNHLQNIFIYYLPLTLLIICGIYITVKARFFQFSKFLSAVKLILKAKPAKNEKAKGPNSLQSACTALAATVGTGNIAGVAGAISIGGAGAIFWMWITAFLCMIIKYAEITLAVLFRDKRGENYLGGPMYYIKKRLPENLHFLSVIFAACTIPAAFCTGNITQSNSAISAVNESIYIRLILGVLFAMLTFLVIFGGAERIGNVTEKIVPVMAIIYTLLCIGIIILNIDFLPQAFKMIISGAFNPKAVTGGAVGSVTACIITGASRGTFSNEAGLGTSAMAHSAAFDADPKVQGLFGIFEVFVDTLLICSLTGLTILCSGVNINYGSVSSTELVARAFSLSYGEISFAALAVMMCFFAFSSIIGWALYGNICAEYLFGKRGKKIFLALYPLGCILGAVLEVEAAWKIAEFFNGIMLTINLPCLLLLSDEYLNIIKGYRKNGKKN